VIRVYAKVNLGLRVSPPGEDGYHRLRGLFQTVSLTDEVELDRGDEDEVVVLGLAAPADRSNLAWRAVAELRSGAGGDARLRLQIVKRIPAMAGLGGASADAAGALIAASRLLGVAFDEVRSIAPRLGSDVPFALVGGTAIVAGRGELISPRPPATGYAMAVVVPPVELATSAVYRMWDALDGPTSPAVAADRLPPSLREYTPLGNDLYPAAVALAPAIEEWRAELAASWGVPIAMTGSGAGLFGLFPTLTEAEDALTAIPVGARFAEAVEPVDRGWEEIIEAEE
jgi:4-diphosphocytidyl-2-C-methyl-D-erythritol kinase